MSQWITVEGWIRIYQIKEWGGEGVEDRSQADERETHSRQREQEAQRKTQGPGTESPV